MKKLFFVFTVVASTIISGCDDKDKDKQDSVPGMTTLDLSTQEFNFPVTMLIPDSTNGPIEITPQNWGAIEVKVGEDFQLSIEQGDGENDDLKLIKSTEIDANEVHKVKKYMIDEPTLVLYETQMLGSDESSFHFYGVFKVGDKNYVVEDIKGESFSEEAVKKMMDSAKSISPKEKGEA